MDHDDDEGGGGEEGERGRERGNGMNWIGSVSELTTSEYICQGPCLPDFIASINYCVTYNH